MSLKISYYVQGRHVMEHLTDEDNLLITVRPIAACGSESDAQTILTALDLALNHQQIDEYRDV